MQWSMIRSTQQPSVSYWRLSDFYLIQSVNLIFPHFNFRYVVHLGCYRTFYSVSNYRHCMCSNTVLLLCKLWPLLIRNNEMGISSSTAVFFLMVLHFHWAFSSIQNSRFHWKETLTSISDLGFLLFKFNGLTELL